MKLKVVHVDDREVIRRSMALFLAEHPDILLVAQLSSGAELLNKLKTVNVDLILLDWHMPGICGVELIACIRNAYPSVPIVVHSANDDILTRAQAMSAGASGFISKSCKPTQLINVILGSFCAGVWSVP